MQGMQLLAAELKQVLAAPWDFFPVLKLFESATRAFCRACGSATPTLRLHNFLGGGCPKAYPNVSSMEHFAAAFAAVRGDGVHGIFAGPMIPG
jgi:hypothetical protein